MVFSCEEYFGVQNPTKELELYQCGVFVEWKSYNTDPLRIGIVTRLSSDRKEKPIKVISLENGFTYDCSLAPEQARVLCWEEGLSAVKSIENRLWQQFQEGLLVGALASRKHYQLEHYRKKMDVASTSLEVVAAVKSSPQEPGTGFYLLLPTYHGNGPSCRNMEAIRIIPRVPEKTAATFVSGLIEARHSFNRITLENSNLEATSGGSLVGVESFEVPSVALDLVKNAPTLEWKLS